MKLVKKQVTNKGATSGIFSLCLLQCKICIRFVFTCLIIKGRLFFFDKSGELIPLYFTIQSFVVLGRS